MVREFRTLEVWKRAIKIGKRVYEIVNSFPKKEDYALSSQLRRAVVSISSNIAEGCGRRTSKDTVQFLYIALGSVNEVESQLYIAREFEYISEDILNEVNNELREIGKMLMGFIGYVSGS
jgi:four helix bundle protein